MTAGSVFIGFGSRSFLYCVGDTLDGMLPNGGITTDMSETVEALKSGISTFMHDISWLMRVLDDVAKIHPFVAGMHS